MAKQKTNEKLNDLSNKYALLYSSKRTTNKLHKETISRYELLVENYIKELVILEEKNKILSREAGITSDNSYNLNWHWIDKIIFVLKQTNRAMRSSEIITALQKQDITLRSWINPQKSLSPHFTRALKYERIIGQKQKGQNGYIYSLPTL